MVDAIAHRCPVGDARNRMKIKEMEVVARDGIEPSTRGFSIRCSTN
jgi:hypothetical protein